MPDATWASEEQLVVRRLAGGEVEALAELYDHHGGAVYALAFRIVGNTAEAEEIVRETFDEVWTQAQRFDAAMGTVSAWLLRITRIRGIDRLRRPRLDVVLRGPSIQADTPSLDCSSCNPGTEAPPHMHSVLNRLPSAQRVVIELAYFEGLAPGEIAERLSQPLETIRTRIRLGMTSLRDALEDSPSGRDANRRPSRSTLAASGESTRTA